jgi:hypothetical protein
VISLEFAEQLKTTKNDWKRLKRKRLSFNNNYDVLMGKWGRILEGYYAGWFIMIDDDSKGETGGYYIYYAKDKDDHSSEGYDEWCENFEQLEKQSWTKLKIDWE